MWQGAFIAPWDWRVRNKKTTILGAVKPPENANAILLASASGAVAPSPDCTIKGNVNRSGECIYHKPTSRWYAQIKMKISKGTRWFCSVEEAEAAGCRETGAKVDVATCHAEMRSSPRGRSHVDRPAAVIREQARQTITSPAPARHC